VTKCKKNIKTEQQQAEVEHPDEVEQQQREQWAVVAF
jgi:hypothetical protein